MDQQRSSTAKPVSSKSEEYRRVQYLLQLSLRGYEVSELCMWNFCNPAQGVEFEKRTRELSTLHSWVDANRLGEGNTLESLHNKGFTFPPNGMQFTCGSIDVSKNFGRGSGSGVAYRFLLCQVGVGRAFVVDEPSEQVKLPPGYDSVYLARAGDNGPDAGNRHDYVILEPRQVLPMYLVQFFADPSPGGVPRSIQQHENVSNSEIQQLYDRYDFFDPILYVPVSVRDKMMGSHSTGELAQHKLIPIGDAYDAALAESLKPDPIVSQRQADIRAQLRAVDSKLREINKNSAEVEEQIYQVLQKALFQLQDATQEKMSALLAEEVELRRQLEQVEWVENFLERERDTASKVDFLNAWKCHVQLRADMTKEPLRTPTVLSTVQADIGLRGAVEIVQGVGARHGIESDARVSPGEMATMTGVVPPPPATAPAPSTVSTSAPVTTEPMPTTAPQAAPSTNGTSPAETFAQRFANMRINPQASPMGQTLAEVPMTFNSAPSAAPSDGGNPFPMGVNGTSSQVLPPSTATPINPSKMEMLGVTPLQGTKKEAKPPPPPSNAVQKPGSSRTPSNLAQYSLSVEAKRRARSQQIAEKEMSRIIETAFDRSKIISSNQSDDLDVENAESDDDDLGLDGPKPANKIVSEAQALYLCIPRPPHGGLPELKLLFATWRSANDRSVQAIVDAFPATIKGPLPTVMLIKANDQVFGGYVNDTWRKDGEGFGSAKSFLFSITKDVKIPFLGRETLPGPVGHPDDIDLPPSYSAAKSNDRIMQFGTKDLILFDSLHSCRSEIECSFGVGLRKGSEEAKTFLAGSSTFRVDELELWSVN